MLRAAIFGEHKSQANGQARPGLMLWTLDPTLITRLRYLYQRQSDHCKSSCIGNVERQYDMTLDVGNKSRE